MWIKQNTESANGKKKTPKEVLKLAGGAFEAVVEFLALEQWPDGKGREKGKLTIFYQDDKFKARLNDCDSDHVAFISADSLVDLLQTVDDHIKEGKLEWRHDQYAEKRKKK